MLDGEFLTSGSCSYVHRDHRPATELTSCRYQIVIGRSAESLALQQDAQRLCEEAGDDFESRVICAEALFCQSEVGLLTSSSSMILEFATKSINLLKSNGDNTWRTPMMYNSLALGNIMIKDYECAVRHANTSIAGFMVLAESDPEHYPDFPIVSKAYALMFMGTRESLESAAQVLQEQQAWRKKTFDKDPVPFK